MRPKCLSNPFLDRGYIGYHMWAMGKLKTHRQIKCKTCGLYHVWVRRRKPVRALANPENQREGL